MEKLPPLGALLPNELHVRRSPKPKRLTKEQRKTLFARPQANAGAGWTGDADYYPHLYDPRRLEGDQ